MVAMDLVLETTNMGSPLSLVKKCQRTAPVVKSEDAVDPAGLNISTGHRTISGIKSSYAR